MGLETMGDGLKTRLETISDIKAVYAPTELPGSINQTPVALILVGDVEYEKSYTGDYDTTFRILLLVSKQDQPSALSVLVPFIEPSGTNSIIAAINGDKTLGGAASSLIVIRSSGMGATIWGGIVYLSTEFEVLVYGTGS